MERWDFTREQKGTDRISPNIFGSATFYTQSSNIHGGVALSTNHVFTRSNLEFIVSPMILHSNYFAVGGFDIEYEPSYKDSVLIESTPAEESQDEYVWELSTPIGLQWYLPDSILQFNMAIVPNFELHNNGVDPYIAYKNICLEIGMTTNILFRKNRFRF